MSTSDIIGTIGVALLLIAYFLNLYKILDQNSKAYIWLNIVGAAMSGLASWLIGFIPFVILEGTWTIVSLLALFKPKSPRISS
jgi:uncharacterized protein with PQ loop repeat